MTNACHQKIVIPGFSGKCSFWQVSAFYEAYMQIILTVQPYCTMSKIYSKTRHCKDLSSCLFNLLNLLIINLAM